MIITNFTPFPVLATGRLILRPPAATDSGDIFSLRSDDSVNKYLENFRHTSIGQTAAFLDKIQKAIACGDSVFWVISLRETNEFAGTICLWNLSKDEARAEAGYVLHPRLGRKGYMREALAMVIEYGFDQMKLKTIEAYTHRDNERSIRLLRNAKFVLNDTATPGADEIVFRLSKAVTPLT